MKRMVDGDRLIRISLAALFVALALPADALEAPKDYAGKWTLSGVSEGDAACTLTLTAEQAIGGWGVDLPKDCIDRFGATEDAAAWTVVPGGAIAFIDPLLHVLLKFEPTEIGGYVAHPAQGEPLALGRAGRSDRELTEQQRMSGTWVLTALGGTPTCTVAMTAAKDGMSGTLRRLGTCRAPWAKTNLARWGREGSRMVLIDRKGVPLISLRGDSLEGFTGATKGVFVGFVRQWNDR